MNESSSSNTKIVKLTYLLSYVHADLKNVLSFINSCKISGDIYERVKGKIVRACDSEGKWTVQIDGRERKKISVRSKNLIFIWNHG